MLLATEATPFRLLETEHEMSRERFVRLILDLCDQCAIGDGMSIVHGAPLEVDGVLFSLMQSERLDPRLLLIYCDIGSPTPGSEAKAYARLLSKNFYFSAQRGPVFTIAPETGRIMMVQTEDLGEVAPLVLASKLQALVVQARAWQEDSSVLHEEPRHPVPGAAKTSAPRSLPRR